MEQTTIKKHSQFKKEINNILNYFSKPQNLILLIFGIVLSIFVITPIIMIVFDTFTVHVGTNEVNLVGRDYGYSLKMIIDLFTGVLRNRNLYEPLRTSLELAVYSSIIALSFGGVVAYLVTRSNLKFKKFISTVFIFPYIMPQWTLAMVWRNLFNSAVNTGGANGLFVTLTGIAVPSWFAQGMFASSIVLGLHYAPFAYILIGGIFKNMDANLEEAATILNTPRWKILLRVTLPMVTPAVLSTVLLVFSGAIGSYPVPHYLNLTTMSVKYVQINGMRPAQASFLSVIMMIMGLIILMLNQRATKSRKSYTTVTGKSGQASKVNLGVSNYFISTILIIVTLFASIYPLIAFTLETFLPNPGDYSGFTLKWWLTTNAGGESGMYGNTGILYNTKIWSAFQGTIQVAFATAFLAGTIGLLVGYAVSKNRKSSWANYVGNIAFFPYLLPSLAVGAAYFVFSNELRLWGTLLILIIVGTVKYIPFASRSSLNAMLQISNEIEEAALIQNIPWHKRMLRIIIPIQKSSIMSGYLLPFITSMRELTLFMMLVPQAMIITTLLDYFDEMGLYAFSSGINLILIIFILFVNWLINRITGASLDKGIGG